MLERGHNLRCDQGQHLLPVGQDEMENAEPGCGAHSATDKQCDLGRSLP